jgi:four helix bundle protein
MVQSFRDLKVWQRSIELAVSVYRLTKGFLREEIYGMCSQMRRCGVSAASNIAEGNGRLNTGEYRQFLGMARGSNFELQTQIEIARKLGFGELETLEEAEALSFKVGKMISSVLNAIKDKELVKGTNSQSLITNN